MTRGMPVAIASFCLRTSTCRDMEAESHSTSPLEQWSTSKEASCVA